MKPPPCILVVSDMSSDAELVRELVHEEFENVEVSTNPGRAVADFERYKPQVLLLAFNKLEKAECYYLGLYRLSTLVHDWPHRTLVLCHKDELRQAYALCKKEYFDDYILFWPMAHDAHRIYMTVFHALRQLSAVAMPNLGEIAIQARGLADLEAQIDRYAAQGSQQVEAASFSLRQAEHEIGAALERLSTHFSEGNHSALGEATKRESLQQALCKLKSEEVDKRFRIVNAAVQPIKQWVSTMKDEFGVQLESARALHDLAARIRPVVLIVEDDEFQHNLLKKILADMDVDLVFAASGMEALASLHKHRPNLILMDVGLPGLDGIETTRRLKAIEQFAQIPVIMITGHSEKAVVVESLKGGASDFVVKPYEKDVLLAKVKNYLHITHV